MTPETRRNIGCVECSCTNRNMENSQQLALHAVYFRLKKGQRDGKIAQTLFEILDGELWAVKLTEEIE